MTRRDLLKHFGTMTAAAIALPHLDLDKLIWTPKPIVVVADMPTAGVYITQYRLLNFDLTHNRWVTISMIDDDRMAKRGPVEQALLDRKVASMANAHNGEWLVTSVLPRRME